MKRIFFPLLLITTILFFESCENSLIPSSTPLSVNDSARSSAPTGITASQGMAGTIQLSWQPVNGASRYYIYGTSEPTPKEADFIQVDQTVNTSIAIKVKEGSTAWYKVAAVDSSFNVGNHSQAVRGSSLARPEITEIVSEEINDDICLKVQWYMSNCNDQTYRQSISYQVCCKDDLGNDYSKTYPASSLDETSCIFENLNPHTKYSVQIVAINNEYGDTEESLLMTEETLHRLSPGAPADLTSDFGSSKNMITLSFTLPAMSDIYYGKTNSYINIPLYFKVYRKAETESSWMEIDSHFGTSDASDPLHPFISQEGTPLTSYTAGTKVIWTDTLPESYRGIMFEYKVQSFIDKEKLPSLMEQNRDTDIKNYSMMETSNIKSIATAKAWTMAIPKLSVKDYQAIKNTESSNTYDSASVKFSFEWENFLLDNQDQNNLLEGRYGFILTESFKPFSMDGSQPHTIDLSYFSNMKTLKEYDKNFTLPSDRGKYEYTVHIVPKNEQDKTKAITSATTTTLIVTDNAGEIENFTVDDGYTDKFIVHWKNNDECNYSLSYIQTSDGIGDGGAIQNVDISTATTRDGITTFVDKNNIPSTGVERIYTLSAEYKNATTAPMSCTSKLSSSLGKPAVEFDENTPSYDSITISWKKIPVAERYTISLDGTEKYTKISANDDSISSIFDTAGNEYCRLTLTREDLGANYYADAKKSGKERNVSVKAFSNNDSSENTVMAKTLGPADMGLETTVAENETIITAKWNKIPGSAGYIVQRYRYRATGQSDYEKDEDTPELFFINTGDMTVKTNSGETVPASTMKVAFVDGKIQLQDTYAPIPASEKDSASQRQITQSRIPWGIPIEYTVIPVLSEKDSFANGKLKSQSIAADIVYMNGGSIAKMGSAIGYGLNVHASKADSPTSIRIDWSRPYIGNKNLRPYIYRRAKGSSAPYSENAGVNISDPLTTSANIICTTPASRSEPYEYAVKYLSSSSNMQNPFVDSYIEKLKSSMDEISTAEQRNVGYAFGLTGLSATCRDSSNNETFTTAVTWDQWNYTKRALGPEDNETEPAYTIWTKNLNVAPGWFRIGQMTADGKVSATTEDWYDAKITPTANCISLTPNGLTDTTGENLGLLKVQRDQKQYYMIRAQRKNSEGKTVYTYLGLDGSVGAYRKISTEEFTKNVLLILADALDQAGISTGGERNCDGVQGKFTVNHPGATRDLYYGTNGNDYVHKFHDLPGLRNTDLVSGYTIKINNCNKTGNCCGGSTVICFPEVTVEVRSHSSNQNSYVGNVKFTAGRAHAAVVWEKDTPKLTATASQDGRENLVLSVSESESNARDRMKEIFPFNMFEGRESKVTSYNSSLAQYKGRWWDIKEGSKLDSEFVDVEGE